MLTYLSSAWSSEAWRPYRYRNIQTLPSAAPRTIRSIIPAPAGIRWNAWGEEVPSTQQTLPRPSTPPLAAVAAAFASLHAPIEAS